MQLPGGFSPYPELPTITKVEVEVEVEVIPRAPLMPMGFSYMSLVMKGLTLLTPFLIRIRPVNSLVLPFTVSFNRMKRGSLWLFSTVFLTVYPSGLLCRGGRGGAQGAPPGGSGKGAPSFFSIIRVSLLLWIVPS